MLSPCQESALITRGYRNFRDLLMSTMTGGVRRYLILEVRSSTLIFLFSLLCDYRGEGRCVAMLRGPGAASPGRNASEHRSASWAKALPGEFTRGPTSEVIPGGVPTGSQCDVAWRKS